MKNHKVDAKTKLTTITQPTIDKWIVLFCPCYFLITLLLTPIGHGLLLV